jgi:hypothetical protein
VKTLFRCAIALICSIPAAVFAQQPPAVPSGASEPQGVMAEPDLITRVVLFSDRHLGKGDLTNGIYVDYGSMIPGAGWASVGPGYKHWYGKDSLFVDASASVSVNSYKQAQARLELPALLKSRLVLGGQGRWQDFGSVDYFGVGADTSFDARSTYGVKSTQIAAYVTLRPVRWLDVDSQIAWLNPRTRYVDGPLRTVTEHQTYVLNEVAMTVDTRDYPGHPTSGVILRAAGAKYDDRRTVSTHTFKRYEGEAAGFLPIAGGRAVLGVHGWMVRSDVEAGRSVPFYLQPSLGGVSSLRSFIDYRFHDDNMLLASAELRLAMMTHVDLALFADAGNVAKRASDLDLDKRSYGVGFRLHTRRQTFASMDMAHGTEGWHAIFRLRDPLELVRLNRKTTIVPFVP